MSFLDDNYGYSLVVVGLLICYVSFQAVIEHKKIHLIHETGFGMLIGLLIGVFFKYFSNKISFSGESFFEIILPPIIFAAGYNLKKKKFFENFFYISLFAVIGTLINFFITLFITKGFEEAGLIVDLTNQNVDLSNKDLLYFSATMCASDAIAALTLINSTVYPKLFSIVFGEGLLNDAVAIILFKSVESIVGSNGSVKLDSGIILELFGSFLKNCFLSVLIGILMAIIATLMTKKFRFLVSDPVKENIFLLLIGYGTYCLAELIDVSSVIALLTSGILMSHYMRYNMSEYGRISTAITVSTLSQIAESFLFIYLGISAWTYMSDANKVSISFIGISFLITCIARIGCIFVTSGIAYLFKKKTWSVNIYELLIIWFSGLIRGAVAFALIITVEKELNDVVISTILFIVFFTTVVLGAFMPFYIQFFIKKMNSSDRIKIKEQLLSEKKSQKKKEKSKKPSLIKKLDEEVLKPLFIYDYYNRKLDIQIEKQKQKEDQEQLAILAQESLDDLKNQSFDPGNNPVLSDIRFLQNQKGSQIQNVVLDFNKKGNNNTSQSHHQNIEHDEDYESPQNKSKSINSSFENVKNDKNQ
ncbi:hypothetical protein ABPG74_019658 [Tetrahymena malaccensis]